jgi:AAA15 family ATPase/GTPase
MLLNFRVSNFLSFNQEAEFSMLAGQVKQPSHHVTTFDKNKVEVLKGAVLYGANASGKSNLIKAIDFARQVVVSGLKKVYARNLFFRLEKGAEERPSKFEFEIKIGEKVYAYGFVLRLNAQKVVEEWLFEAKKSGDKAIFERKVLANGSSEMQTKPSLRGAAASRFNVYVSDLSAEQLLVNVLHDKQGDEFAMFGAIYHWLRSQLITFYPNSTYYALERMLQGEIKEEFRAYLRYFKTGIEDIEAEEEEMLGDDGFLATAEPVEINLAELVGQTHHAFGLEQQRSMSTDEDGDLAFYKILGKYRLKGANDTATFDLGQESDGNRRLLDIIPLLIVMNRTPKTVFIDEIDRSLHPELTRRLLEVFFQKNRQPDSQLILTTHESSLLDLTLLRRDEIWFAEKNADGESRLYSLEEFKPRFDAEIRKAYLQGRYGAIPFIADVNQLGWQEN